MILFIVSIVIYYDATDKKYQKIKFKSFRSFYDINKSRWTLFDTNYNNYYCNKVECGTESTYYGYRDNVIMRFGFIDYYRYILWRKSLIKIKKKKENKKDIEKVLNAVKQDIDKMNEQSRKEIEEGKRILNSVLE